MYPEAFALVSSEDPTQVVAVGLTIIGDEVGNAATITYRCGPDGRGVIGQHDSVEAAHARYNHLTPVTLRWGDELRAIASHSA